MNKVFAFLLLLFVYPVMGQTASVKEMGLQYGFSVKLLGEISVYKNTQRPFIKLVLNGGVGSKFLMENVYPCVNIDLMIYNGGIGTSKHRCNPYKSSPLNMDLITSLTLTSGYNYKIDRLINYNVKEYSNPLYYFSNFVNPSLANPYKGSVSLGTNLIFSTGKEFQRVGFINIHLDKFQFSYYNDGGKPIRNIYLGDRRDRYYTGGVVISFFSPMEGLNALELAYHKFTGYSLNAFEVASLMGFTAVHYKDDSERYFNKSIWSLRILPEGSLPGININWNNGVKHALQHTIHWFTNDAYHLEPFKSFPSVGLEYNYMKSLNR